MSTLDLEKKKAIEMFLRDIPEIDYSKLTDYYGFAPPELRILDLRYRKKMTREELAYEEGVSVPTLDRKLNSIVSRIAKYFDRFLIETGLKTE